MKRPKVVIYTDGACSNGRGGWAACLHWNTDVVTLTGNEDNTTNNRMELTPVIRALESLTTNCDVELYSDSQYVLNGIMSWVRAWKRNGWKNRKGEPVLNRSLWERMLEQINRHKVKTHWVKGHNGDPNNEAVDSLAQLLRQLPV